jgi:outer membrane protein assembly factor BamA
MVRAGGSVVRLGEAVARKSALAGACVLVLVGAPATAHAQLRGLEIESVRFEGNEVFPDDSLARAIVTQETDCRNRLFLPFCWLGADFALRRGQLRERELPRDQARLIIWYQRRGFRDVQVDTAVVVRDDPTAGVLFRVVEGTPVIADSISFVGADELDIDGLLDDLPMVQGDRLSTLALDETSDLVTRRLKNEGYAHAAVFRRTLRPRDDAYKAEVTFEIVPGPTTTYGAINVSGLESLGFGTVRRALQFSSGERYRLDDVTEARGRLYGLDMIQSASVIPDTLSADPVVDVDVIIQEGDVYRVRTGIGWSTAECMSLEARWASRNFLGGGRLLQVRGRVGNLLAAQFRDVFCPQSGVDQWGELTWLASVDLVQPWIFSTRNELTGSVFAERQSLPDIFVRRAVGAQLSISRRVSSQTTLTAFYRPELSELDADNVLFCTGMLVCAPEDIEALEAANRLAPVGMNVARDGSDDLLNPRRGSRLTLDIEHAASWTGSEFRYDRIVGEATRYTPFGEGALIATRVRAGWVGSGGFEGLLLSSTPGAVVHPQKRFYAGGANSVRGFGQGQLGVRVVDARVEDLLSDRDGWSGCDPVEVRDLLCTVPTSAVGRFEIRPTGGTRVFEMNAEVRVPLGAFFEGAFFTDVGQSWGQDQEIRPSDLEFSPGLGIRFPSPVGPIRVDVAYSFREGEQLRAVTSQISPYDPNDLEQGPRLVVDGTEIAWVSTGDLKFLFSDIQFDPSLSFWSRLQLHVSIGQAF